MDNSSTYSSLLNSYLYESQTSLAKSLSNQKSPIPEINIDDSGTTDTPSCTSPPATEFARFPNELQISPNNTRRNSVVSSLNSVYTSSIFSTDHDIEHLREKVQEKTKTKRHFKRSHGEDYVFSKKEDDNYHSYINKYLNTNIYAYSTSQVLNLNWNEIFEIYLFGNLVSAIFTDNQSIISSLDAEKGTLAGGEKQNDYLMSYLFNNPFEKGELKFTIDKFLIKSVSEESIVLHFDSLLKNLDYFEQILSLYSDENNYESDKLFHLFQEFIGKLDFPIPLALSMFGNFLLSFGGSKFDYQNEEVMIYFRKAARFSWIIKLLNEDGYFERVMGNFTPSDQQRLKQFFNKDNKLALSISLYNLGEFYKSHNDIHTAINIWELNARLTGDQESCNLAIWGLTDGYGSGNKVTLLNKFGKKSRTNKHNTKRRIAQLYRLQDSETVGLSWIWKSKYD